MPIILTYYFWAGQALGDTILHYYYFSNVILNQGIAEKMRKYSEIAKACNISFVPLIFLDW